MYFGSEAMRVGVLLFGNGHLVTLPDGSTSITPAKNIQPLTADFATVRSKIAELKWQRGFTNMAQAFTLADTMLSQGGRSSAQSAVLMLSDGKYSFKYQTQEKARELKDKKVQIYMTPVSEFEGTELETLKQWASQPWETNFERIPGLAALKYNADLFVEKIITKFCPDSMSPSMMKAVENQKQYILIHENGWPTDACGVWFYVGKVNNKDDCASASRARGDLGFAFGKSYAAGRCYSEKISISQALWNTWQTNRSDIPCPNGDWADNPFYDTYALNPATVA